jgi:hypothetical protein
MPRTPRPRSEAQQKEHERRQALTALDVSAMRAWAVRYSVGLLGDDKTVLISMHETRVIDRALPMHLRRESRDWLTREYPESVALQQRAMLQ